MKIYDIAFKTQANFIVEHEGVIIFKSYENSLAEFKEVKFENVKRIEPETDGGQKLLHLYV